MKVNGSQYKPCNEKLNILMEAVGDTQLSRVEYAYISSFLMDGNFLVFGTGHDSEYWRCVNANGFTLFLEDDDAWIDKKHKDIVKVIYTTKRSQYRTLLKEYLMGNYTNLSMALPNVVRNTRWDAIFVDAPVGNSDESAGRMQSIFAAKQLASKNTKVFVHDCNRPVEDMYTSLMFDTMENVGRLRRVRKNDSF